MKTKPRMQSLRRLSPVLENRSPFRINWIRSVMFSYLDEFDQILLKTIDNDEPTTFATPINMVEIHLSSLTWSQRVLCAAAVQLVELLRAACFAHLLLSLTLSGTLRWSQTGGDEVPLHRYVVPSCDHNMYGPPWHGHSSSRDV